ncbi:DinB family protein [Streptomyces acidiscabies]|uniref:Uncharacterized protein n=1 Tax=Streptomyces acidiscabies TaxID=42234 RepID=A0A0L0JC84_9ACTN|nr:DinB family protein [Streptomyces acidiscabies]KND23342.1 hypothetical protein IQ63_44855 [Streptomyces acidiscabies]
MDHKDVDAAVAELLRVLGPRTSDDWTVPAGPLEWTCWETAAHIGHDLLAYAAQLAAQPTDGYLPIDLNVRPTASPAEVLQAVTACGGLLSSALATAETLLHTHDITQGLSVDWRPPAPLSTAVLTRLFPTAPPGDPTQVLLWCTGRGELTGLPRQTSWRWQAAQPD